MAHIAVNTRLLLKNRLEGLGMFTHETLQRIVKAHPEHQFSFFFDRPFDEQFVYEKNVTAYKLFPPARHPFLYYWWFEWSVSKQLKKIQPDLFLSPDGYLSLRSKCKQLAVIHDINFEHFPEYFDLAHRFHYRHYFPKYAKKATRIATVSEFSKQDIVHEYHVDASKIDVVYNGIHTLYAPVVEDVKIATRNKYTQGAPYFVFIGGLYPRKNLIRLAQAFGKFKTEHTSDIKLVIVGKGNKFTQAFYDFLAQFEWKNDIILTGRVDDEKEVQNLLGSALALTYVSTFEGFGIPIIEAMQCGTPVITSNTSCLPEIGGEAALYVDPFSIEDIASGLKKMAENLALQKQLVDVGFQQIQGYSWDKTAQLLWNSIEKCL